MIKIEGLNVYFGDQIIIKNFNADIPVGITAVNGPSGIGKTTLLNVLAGLKEYKGEITGINGKSVSFAFQEFRLFDTLTAFENVKIAVKGQGDIKKIIKDMEMDEFQNKYPGELSGGMQQRVSLARALAKNADIILLDEPFTALDEGLKKRIAQRMKPYLEDKTTVMVTHNSDDFSLLPPNKIIEL